MKLFAQALTYFSVVCLSLSPLHAKTVQMLLDHQTSCQLAPQNGNEMAACKSLKIENVGEKVVKNCFPHTSTKPCFSLETLASQLAVEEYPLIALYQRWERSVARDEHGSAINCHPLDLMNFKGVCSKQEFSLHFIKLCNALGIQTRLANVRDKEIFDFCLNDEWHLLDTDNDKLYLALSNDRIASSEEVMDDPFLALRTKLKPADEPFNFIDSYRELARFDILEPASAMPVVFSVPELPSRPSGYDLYPRESFVISKVTKYESKVEHLIDLEARRVAKQLNYHSPIPICKLENQTSATLKIKGKNIKLKPGESVTFEQRDIFQLSLSFSKKPAGQLVATGMCAWSLLPEIKSGQNVLFLGPKKNHSQVLISYDFDERGTIPLPQAPSILNSVDIFDYCSPTFTVQNISPKSELIRWQISLDPQFKLIPSNLDQVEQAKSTITLPLISETFLNPDQTYYFRMQHAQEGIWSEWSKAYAFQVHKPQAIEFVEFDELSSGNFELNWERFAEESEETIEYLVFGSNSLDFIPSLYCDKQVNVMIDGVVMEEEHNDNLIAVTTETRLKIKDHFAYYRIIARKKGQLSVPSPLIRFYDDEVVHPRTVLQLVDSEPTQAIAKRTLFPYAYPYERGLLPRHTHPAKENNLIKLQMLLRSASALDPSTAGYESPEVTEAVWEEVGPYLLPPNHPAWPKLNRVFCKTRATKTPEDFKKAGFKRWRPGRWSRVSASSHPEFQEYFIKAYCDVETGILYDWRKWIHRIKGAETIRDCIKKYELQNEFKVPHKWIYPLPKNPSPPNSSSYLRKNFILVCENMRIEEHSSNEKLYKKMDRHRMKGLYTVLQVCGLYDSVYCFNIPYCKDGRIAVIDTEYHHKWPVPFHKLKKSFSKDSRAYWENLTHNGGPIPNGVNQPNPPRMDRRDRPEKPRPAKAA